MNQIPKIKPEISFTVEDDDTFALLCTRLMEMQFDRAILDICATKKYHKVTIGYREYAEHWYLLGVLNDFMSRIPFWNDSDFHEFFVQNKIKMGMCIVIYQYGTYPGMSIDNKELGLLNKFNGDLDFDIYNV